jgi:radical SAM superfamily enzyme YgiQ (UPF0313 family)
MKILLVQPAKAESTIGGDDISVFEPLALEYVAAGVTDAHEVRILDLRIDPDFERALAALRPDFVGFTAFTVHVNGAKALCRSVKGWAPDVLTVVGGHHATVWPHDFDDPSVDLVVRGEGVVPFQEIVARRERGLGFDGIPGVCHRDGGGLVIADPLPVADLDALPIPARRLTAAYRDKYFSEWLRPLASICTSRGCPHRCTFCAQWRVSGGRYVRRSPEAIVEELRGMVEPFVFFADDESLYDIARMRRLAELIRDSGIRKRYFIYARSETVVKAPEVLALWRSVGLERVFVGFEFFREDDMEFVNKGSTIAENEEAVRILKSLGIEIYASFMVRPEYTHEDFAAFRRYVRGLKLSFATFSVLTPLPGTVLREELEDRIVDRDYDHVDFIHSLLPTALPPQEFYAELGRLYAESMPLSSRMGLLRKIPLRDLPKLQAAGTRFQKRLKTAHLD